MTILVTGGLGYIGSHTVVELQNSGYEVVIIDNLSNSSITVLDAITAITGIKPHFYQFDLTDLGACQKFFAEYYNLQGIIHFAAAKSVNESVTQPLLYYENNLFSLINILKCLDLHGSITHNFIFSSSCSVYGNADTTAVDEHTPFGKAESPYGYTKQVCETMLDSYAKIKQNFNLISLRYFNPVGAHSSCLIGELPIGIPQNLVPVITQTAAGKREQLTVYGDDYPTLDGTCIRDYIHVMDLAVAHRLALEKIQGVTSQCHEVLNLGTGRGISVLELIQTFVRVNNVSVNYVIGERRAGDVVEIYTNNTKLKQFLNWLPSHSVEEALASAWQWQLQQL